MRKECNIRVSKSSAWLYFWLAGELTPRHNDAWKLENYVHKPLFEKCLRAFKAMGYKVTANPYYQENFKCLSKYHKYAIKDGLECEIEICQTNFKFEFFQNLIQGERKPGDGKYEFKKLELMPYLMQKQMELAFNKLIKIISAEHSITVEQVDTPVLSANAIVKHCTNNHWKVGSPVTVDDIVNCVRKDEGSYNTLDKNKKQIISGEIKYFRDSRTGRLMYGKAYHNINNMWWVILDKFKYTNIACFELFDATEDDFKQRRKVKNRMPESKKQELELLKSFSTAKLTALLRKSSKKTHA